MGKTLLQIAPAITNWGITNADFGEIIGNVRKHRDVKFVTTETKRNYLVSEKYYTAKSYRKFFLEKFKSYRSKKTLIFMNKSAHLGLSILEISKILMYEFWYYYVKAKYGKNAKWCSIDTDSFKVSKKQKIFTQTLQKMLKLDLILQIVN